MTDHLVSVIIVNFNGKHLLDECLTSLFHSDYPCLEVIVVDNNSTDNSVSYMRHNFPKVTVIQLDKNCGFAEPCNIGARNANGVFLHFLNNDTKVTSTAISELVKMMNQDPKIAICQSLLLHDDESVDSSGDFLDTNARAYNRKKLIFGSTQILSARGASMMIKKDVFKKLGEFDPFFFASFEDVDLGLRAWIFGYEVRISQLSVVYHYGGKTMKFFSKTIQFHSVKNNIMLRMINFESSFVVRTMFYSFVGVLKNKFFPKKLPSSYNSPISICAIAKGIIWILKNFGHISKRRKFVSHNRRRTTCNLRELNLMIDPPNN